MYANPKSKITISAFPFVYLYYGVIDLLCSSSELTTDFCILAQDKVFDENGSVVCFHPLLSSSLPIASRTNASSSKWYYEFEYYHPTTPQSQLKLKPSLLFFFACRWGYLLHFISFIHSPIPTISKFYILSFWLGRNGFNAFVENERKKDRLSSFAQTAAVRNLMGSVTNTQALRFAVVTLHSPLTHVKLMLQIFVCLNET